MFDNRLSIRQISRLLTCQQTQSLLVPGVKLYKYTRWYFKLMSKMLQTTTRRYCSMVKITKTNKQRINLCYLPLLKSSSLPDIICCHLRLLAWHHHLLPSPAFFPAYPIRAHLSVYLLPQAGRASFVWMDTSKAGTWERKGLIST